MKTKIISLLCAVAFPAAAQHNHHTHGEGTVNMVLDADQLMFEFTLSASDIVGFEHQPQSDEEHRAMRKARIRLNNAVSLITPNNAGHCHLVEKEINSSMFSLNTDKHSNEHQKDNDHSHHHDNDDQHDSGAHNHSHKNDGHSHHNDSHHHDETHTHDSSAHNHSHHDEHKKQDKHHSASHTDIELTYLYSCQQPEKLNQIEISFFKYFSSLTQLKLQGIIGQRQFSQTLSASKKDISW